MSVTIFAVIFVAVAGAFFSGVRLWGRISRADVPDMFMALDLQKLGRDLRMCIDIPLVGFTGSRTGLSFPAVLDTSVVRVVYAFDPAKKELLRSVYPFDPAKEDGFNDAQPAVSRLFRADELVFEYLDHGDNESVWLEAWPAVKGVFRAVRVRGSWKGAAFGKIIIIPQI